MKEKYLIKIMDLIRDNFRRGYYMSLFNWKMVFAAFCIMFLLTACSKKIMPPEIETSSGSIEGSDFTASNTNPTEEETDGGTGD